MKKILLSLIILVGLSGCSENYLDRTPTDAVSINYANSTANTAKVYLNGVYKYFYKYAPDGTSQHDNNGMITRLIYDDALGLDLIISANWYSSIYLFQESRRRENNNSAKYNWNWAYQIIKDANTLIASSVANEGSDPEWTEIAGQAFALRAFGYYQLCNLYQKHYRVGKNLPGFPLMLEAPISGSDMEYKPRGVLDDVYTQMVKDCKEAIGRLTSSRDGVGYINQNVAQGLLARIYTDMAYVDNTLWDEVITLAQDARAGFSLMTEAQFQSGFNTPTVEWMWGMMNDQQGATAYPAFFSFYDLDREYGYQNFRVDPVFMALFDADDCRGELFKDTYSGMGLIPNPELRYRTTKFRDITNHVGSLPLMRAAEMYLLEAEAHANKGDNPTAQSLVDDVRAARITGYIPAVAPAAKDDMLELIWVERRKELFGEGFALKDILRFGWFVNGAKATRGSAHTSGLGITVVPYNSPAPVDNDYRYIFQIPEKELQNNPYINEGDQNP